MGGRYRLLRPVGSGASAHVYVAEDVRLKRRVALKVLHPALAQDRSFLRRFQMEAQVVAALRHPGIVRVYDWGEEEEDAYLAMELLDGGSLRGLLDTGYRLTVSQAAALGVDVASALAHAHARGLVHRDVKPANLLFDEEGHASVADFGIARALAEASWTEPMGALVGTARYAAPEQLQGSPLDGRADVYALCLVLVECVTGAVPFARDTMLGALMARATQPVPVPEELGPLAPVLRAAGVPGPEDRLTAAELAERIAGAARHLRAPARLPVVGLVVTGTDQPEHTELGQGRRPPEGPGLSVLVDPPVVVDGPALAGVVADPEEDGARPPVPAAPDELEVVPVPVPVEVGPGGGTPPDQVAAGPEQVPEPGSADRPAPPAGPLAPGPVVQGRRSRRRQAKRARRELAERERREARAAKARARPRRWPRRAAALVVVAGASSGGVAAYYYLTLPPPTYSVPSLTGDLPGQAASALGTRHLELVVSGHDWSATTPSGRVLSQFPGRGSRLHAKQVVTVVLSRGPEPVAVPSLATLDLAQARSALVGQRLVLGTVAHVHSMTVPAGSVISWSATGRKVLPGTAVNVVLSAGKPRATVPSSAVGSSYSALASQLAALHLGVHELEQYDSSVAAGLVLSTSPAPGTSQVVGTVVTVDVSLGPHLVTIPSAIVGMSQGAATQYLLKIGLYVSGVQGSPLAAVSGSVPAVGQQVLYGRSIELLAG